MQPLGWNPLEFLDETYPEKTRGMGLPYGENFVTLTSTVFVWSTRLTDGRAKHILSRAKNGANTFAATDNSVSDVLST